MVIPPKKGMQRGGPNIGITGRVAGAANVLRRGSVAAYSRQNEASE